MYGDSILLFFRKGVGNYIFFTGVLMLFNIKFGKYFYLSYLAGNKGFFFVKNFLKFINW